MHLLIKGVWAFACAVVCWVRLSTLSLGKLGFFLTPPGWARSHVAPSVCSTTRSNACWWAPPVMIGTWCLMWTKEKETRTSSSQAESSLPSNQTDLGQAYLGVGLEAPSVCSTTLSFACWWAPPFVIGAWCLMWTNKNGGPKHGHSKARAAVYSAMGSEQTGSSARQSG